VSIPAGRAVTPGLAALGRPAELLRLLDAALADLTPEDLPAMIGELEGLKARLLLRIIARQEAAPAKPEADRFISIEEVSAALRRSKAWVYDNWKALPFASQKTAGGRIWFSEAGLEEYVRSGGRPTAGAETP